MKIVGISGSLSTPSRTTTLVTQILQEFVRSGAKETVLVSLAELAPALGSFNPPSQALTHAFQQVREADVVVVASPVYKASYTGLLKHFFDLLEPKALQGKTALLAATGGSERHTLVIEHQLRPLLSFFDTHTVPTGVYLNDTDFLKGIDGHGYRLASAEAQQRIERAVAQAQRLTPWRNTTLQASAA